ncbi:carbonic anhydrase 14-like [Belonocnema kinseyi]|uniref:carbonic anhydrase 14-like n=1 Tax=Belonocnema kinseyi TaxID=2817044 RepID=UPI00143D60E9|nr:carbonic anhydrase 14-like [Belonocnema kinseyi]
MEELRSEGTSMLVTVVSAPDAYSYKDAKNWGQKYEQCNGKRQSPIFTRPQIISPYPHLEGLTHINFNKLPTNMTIKNTGRAVELRARWSGNPPEVTGGPLHAKYLFDKITFHWAEKPSEYDVPLKVFDNLEKNLHKVRSRNAVTDIPPFDLNKTIDNRVVPFVFYEGSLDYPPCMESVTWFVDDDGSSIHKNLVNELRKIKLDEGDVSNIRPTQAINKRPLKISFGDNAKSE